MIPALAFASVLLLFLLISIRPTFAEEFAGSSSCRECHEAFYKLWAPSHHGTAMQPFTRGFSQGGIADQAFPLAVEGASYRADIGNGVVIEQGSNSDKRYPIAYVMGGKNVYYFLTPLDRGRLQVLPVAWDVRRRQWYDMAASAVRHLGGRLDRPLHWREAPFTFNTSCYNCHVSQLSKNYDSATDSYRTAWKEPGINCETCHGPGAEHIQAARAIPPGQKLKDPRLIVTRTLDPERMNSLCGSCHARLSPLTSAFSPGERFFDHFTLTGLEHDDFYPDGRDLGENFTMTTWQMSPCVKTGPLDCMHCHTSSGRYRFEGEKANGACLPCHAERVRNVAAHSRHKEGTEGAKCVSCHMPSTEFARMRRTDHSMRPPMPALTVAMRSPNACNVCHTDKDAAWSDRAVREWHPQDYQAAALENAALIAAARRQDWTALPEMVKRLVGAGREEIWSASLLRLLAPCADVRKWSAIQICLQDKSPLVRAAAAEACSESLNAGLIRPLLAATRDSYRLVRIRAAAALASAPQERMSDPERAALRAATDELEASLLSRPDDWASHYNLGNFHLERRAYPKAIAAFQKAITLAPMNIPPRVNMALAYSAAGQNTEAEASLRQALRLEPTNAVSNLNFGMLLAELGKLDEAETAFRTAYTSDTNSAAAAYNLGVLLARAHPEEALAWSRRAAELRPQEAKYAYTLAYFLAQRGKVPKAIAVLEKAIEAAADPDAYALLAQLHQQAGQTTQMLDVYRQAAADGRLPEDIRAQFARRAEPLSQ